MKDRHYLIGTAGHVDHGKTELIKALTGMDTDRLKEEKQRGISIELGFAHLALPSGRQVGIVDVPGHERFVRQMLAGASGMDAVLLVIAADEGIMPQTREHLDILTLLGVTRGIVVLNKIDLVEQEWQELIEEEIHEELKDSLFANAPICPVSALKGEGIPQLLDMIDKLLTDVESKEATGPTRMPIDRVFTIQGFGTVVTGTLHSGTIELGQELLIEPGNIPCKPRSIQVHGEKVSLAKAGQRVAVNLAGLDVDMVDKGVSLASPGAFSVGNVLDLKVANLPSSDKPIVQRQRVRFHIGTSEILGRIHLLGQDEISPGQDGYAQIILEEPTLAAVGDRFVLRFYSPTYTIGGGKVLGVAKQKHKRFNESALAHLHLKDQGNPLELLERELDDPKTLQELEAVFHVGTIELQGWLQGLNDSGRLEVWQEDGCGLYWAKSKAERWRSRLAGTVRAYQKQFPLRGGIGREELRGRLAITWPHRRWQLILEQGAQQEFFKLNGGKVQTVEEIEWPANIAKGLENLKKRWVNVGLTPPDLETIAQECGISCTDAPEYAQYLCEQSEWVSIEGFYFTKKAMEQAQKLLVDYLRAKGELPVSEAREIWGTSRKFAVPLLEYFDQQRITRRLGDKRILY